MAKKKEDDMFEKEQIIKSKQYADNRDVLNALLVDGESYSISDVDTLLDNFMKGKVK